MPRLYEVHRPNNLDEIVAQPRACEMARRVVSRGLGGNAVLISGASGTGKTTIAHIMAQSIADPFNIQEFDAIDATPARIAQIEQEWHYHAIGCKTGRVWIVNEAHTMTSQAVGKWLTALERIPDHCAIIFTTTSEGLKEFDAGKLDAQPFRSRCVPIKLTNQGLAKPFAAAVREIAITEGLNNKQEKDYLNLARSCNNNFRAMLQAVEVGEMAA